MRTDMPPRHPTVYITQTGQESPNALPQLLHMEAHQNSLLYPLLRTHAHLYHSTPRCFLARTFIGQESQHKCIKPLQMCAVFTQPLCYFAQPNRHRHKHIIKQHY